MFRQIAIVLSVAGISLSLPEQQAAAAPPEKQQPDDPKTKDNRDLVLAAYQGNFPALQALLKKGVDPNWIDPRPFHKTALTAAALSGRLNTVKALVENGADVNLPDNSGRYPVCFAFHSNRDNKDKAIELLQFLLAKGADKSLNNESGRILVYLCSHGVEHPDMIEFLVKAGADPNLRCQAKSMSGWTPLTAAIRHGNPKQRMGLCKALIASKADVNFKDGRGMSPLQWAKKGGDKELIALLEQTGAKE